MAKTSYKELQKQLDEIKWACGEKSKCDPSGDMDYCTECKYSSVIGKGCNITQEERIKKKACAKAYLGEYKN